MRNPEAVRLGADGMPDPNQEFDVEVELTYVLTCRVTNDERVIIEAAHGLIGGCFVTMSSWDELGNPVATEEDLRSIPFAVDRYAEALTALMRDVRDRDMDGIKIRSISAAPLDEW